LFLRKKDIILCKGVMNTVNNGFWNGVLGLLVGFAMPLGAEEVETVTGRVAVGELGMILSHEHVLVDFVGAEVVSRDRYDRDAVITKALPHVRAAYARGVRTIVECTPNFMGRDPELLRRLSEETGMRFLTNTGLYGAANDKFLPKYAWEKSAAELAARWIGEAQDGIEGTGIKPAFLKLAVDREATLAEVDAKLIAAGAIAHRETGLTMAVHTGAGPGLAQLAILAEHGVAAEAWIWVHAQGAKEADLLAAAKQGAWISLDGLREKSVERHVELALLLREAGYWSQLLVSHDAGWFDPGKPEGGTYRGYEVLFIHFLPELRSAGVTEAELEQLLVRNPARAFRAEKRLLEVGAASRNPGRKGDK
jgi:phosphotriesterase-related protein